MKPPAPNPVSGLSVTNEVRTAAIAASTAFPPSRRTVAPASAVRGWPAATAPRVAMARSLGLSAAGDELRDVDREIARTRLEARRGARATIRRAPDRRRRGA